MPNEQSGERTTQIVKEWLWLWAKLLGKVLAALSIAIVAVHVVFAPMLVGAYVERGLTPLEAWSADAPGLIWILGIVPWWGILATGIISAYIVTERDRSE